MARTHRGPVEKLVVYDPTASVKPHVYDKDRRYSLLVVDMLYDFVYGKIKCDRSVQMIPRTEQLLDAAHGAGVPVFYVNDSHTRKDFEMYRWGEHAMRGTRGAKIISQLRPRKSDIQIPKQTYSSFYGTRLERELKKTHDGKGANTLVLSGLHADCCVRHTCADGCCRGYETLVAEDAVESFTGLAYRTGLQYVKYWYLTDVLPTKKIVKLF